MFTHGPSCLQGPVSRSRWQWHTMTPDYAEDTPPAGPAVRTDLVERVRREIAAGTYDTPEKFDIALERLLDRLEGGTP